MIGKIIQFSINYRYFVLFISILVAFFGFQALQKLPLDAVPDITNNQIQINTEVLGLTPEQVEKQATLPIENALKGIPGLESTRSLSRDGFSQVTAVFEDGVDIYFARQQVNERLSEVREDLPSGADLQMGPISTGLSEIAFWSVEFDLNKHSSPGKPGLQTDGSYITPERLLLNTEKEKLSYLRTVQDWIIKPQLQSVEGLAGVDAIGGYIMQYHVEPNLSRLASLNITLKDLKAAIEDNNLSLGSGVIEQRGEALLVQSDARLKSIADLKEMVIANASGQPIFLRDVAEITLGQEKRSGSSSRNGQEAVIGTAMMLIGENSRQVAAAVNEKLQQIKSTMPEGIEIFPLLNRSKLIDSTIDTVMMNLAEGALLVIAVLFLMLGHFRAALITAIVIPLSMLMTSIGMVQSHISGNLMSLGAIDFGLIVDGAIIISENCLTYLSRKRKELGRALTLDERLVEVTAAAKEMIQPSVFGQIIIIVVYLPLMTLSGVEGKMFQPMALTVIFALTSAFILSLTFIPALIALFVKDSEEHGENNYLEKVKVFYKEVLQTVLKNPAVTLFGALSLVIISCLLFFTLGQEFAPTLDEQDIAVQATRSPSTSLAEATKMQKQVEKVLLGFPEVETVFSKTGTAEMASDPMPVDASDTFVILKPRSMWPDPSLSKSALIDLLDEKLKTLTGNNFEFTQPIQMRFNELIAGVKSDVAVKIYGDDLNLLQKTGNRIASVLKALPGANDVVVDVLGGSPQFSIALDRLAISRFGLNVKDVFETLQIAIGGEKAGVIYEGDRHFNILIKLHDDIRQNLSSLKGLPIPLPNGKTIPLSELADFSKSDGVSLVNREQGKRMLAVEANVRGIDLSSFVESAKAAVASKVKLPSGYWIEWDGQFTHLISAKERLYIVAPLCLISIFALLCLAFGSLKEAAIVFTGVPLALTGGILALFFRNMVFSISAAVGFIALSGIAVLNGLVLVSCIRRLVHQNSPLEEAIKRGSLMRLRPVLMTAFVASLGFLPMAFATGPGAEVQKPLATVVIGGLLSSTFLTLIVLPAIYVLFYQKIPLFTVFSLLKVLKFKYLK